MQFPTQWVAGGGALGLMVFASFVGIRLLRLLNAQLGHVQDGDEAVRAENTELKRALGRCQGRLVTLVQLLITHDVPVPSGMFNGGAHDE